MALAQEADAIAAGVPADPRSDDEILGYNEPVGWDEAQRNPSNSDRKL